jgi:hypothetical protein
MSRRFAANCVACRAEGFAEAGPFAVFLRSCAQVGL